MPSTFPSRSETHGDDDLIDVVVPVYNNFEDAQRLFEHLSQASNTTACRLVVIDDASSQDAGLHLRLPLPGGCISNVCFLRNEENLGFAATVNKAMRLGRRDVVLLNTDTLVFDGWLDRLRIVSRSQARVGTVTPFSNAATILSYPTFPDEFKSELEIGWSALDTLFAEQAANPVAIPTGIGFCMLITRECIDACGYFDDVAFRNGYGEECDFCRRAASAGWSNLAAANVFVWHRGEGSFAERARVLRDSAQQTLRIRHPDYPSLVARFIADDPLAEARLAIDLARIAEDCRPSRLHLRIGPPDQPDAAFKEMFFTSEGRLKWYFRPHVCGFAATPNLPRFSVTTPRRTLRDFLIETHVERVVTHEGGGLSPLSVRRFLREAVGLDLPISRFADCHPNGTVEPSLAGALTKTPK